MFSTAWEHQSALFVKSIWLDTPDASVWFFVPYWDTQFKNKSRNKITIIEKYPIYQQCTLEVKHIWYFIDMRMLSFLLGCHKRISSLSFRRRLNNLRRAKHEKTPHWTLLKTGQKVFSKQIDHLQKWAQTAAEIDLVQLTFLSIKVREESCEQDAQEGAQRQQPVPPHLLTPKQQRGHL